MLDREFMFVFWKVEATFITFQEKKNCARKFDINNTYVIQSEMIIRLFLECKTEFNVGMFFICLKYLSNI